MLVVGGWLFVTKFFERGANWDCVSAVYIQYQLPTSESAAEDIIWWRITEIVSIGPLRMCRLMDKG